MKTEYQDQLQHLDQDETNAVALAEKVLRKIKSPALASAASPASIPQPIDPIDQRKRFVQEKEKATAYGVLAYGNPAELLRIKKDDPVLFAHLVDAHSKVLVSLPKADLKYSIMFK